MNIYQIERNTNKNGDVTTIVKLLQPTDAITQEGILFSHKHKYGIHMKVSANDEESAVNLFYEVIERRDWTFK